MSPPPVESDDTEVGIFGLGKAAQVLIWVIGVDDQGDRRDLYGLRAISGKVCVQT